VSFTDAHPRNYGNSIYYFEFRDGGFHKADGSYIKSLARDGPVKPSEAELIYKGSSTHKKPQGADSVPGAAWTSCIKLDSEGRPHVAYTVHHSISDHRYRLASWDGTRWIDREIAFGGTGLYPAESSYSGLVTLDPGDPTQVFISTDVNPITGKHAGGSHEIYRAKIALGDDSSSINWQPVTQNSPVRNIRPLVLRYGDKRIVIWLRGIYQTFTNYQLDAVGFIEPAN
jgi:hypothetical protein